MSDIITIGIYRKEIAEAINTGEGQSIIKEGFTDTIKDMLNIKHKFGMAAVTREKAPPKLYISFLLIPNWKENENSCAYYGSASYVAHKDIYMKLFTERLAELLDADDSNQITIIDCLEDGELTEAEKYYMENLTALGSNADIIKTRAIIARQDHNHLQLDSNTKIFDYQALYDDIFGNEVQAVAYHADMKASHDIDKIDELPDSAFNASYYDEDYVSVHNKIVYVPERSVFIHQLQKAYYRYCDMVNNVANPDEKSMLKTKNAIYSKVFTKAAEAVGVARRYEVPLNEDITKIIYPAILDKSNAFRLTRHIVTAVNQSWKLGQIHPLGFDDVKRLPGINFGDTTFDFACYNIAKKKLLTGILSKHPVDNDRLLDSTIAKSQLHAISNIDNEAICVVEFEKNAIICINQQENDLLKGAMLDIIFSRWDNREARVLQRIMDSGLPSDKRISLIQCFYDCHEPEYQKTYDALIELSNSQHDIKFDMFFLKLIIQSDFSESRKNTMVQMIKDSRSEKIHKWSIAKEHERLSGVTLPLSFSMSSQSNMKPEKSSGELDKNQFLNRGPGASNNS